MKTISAYQQIKTNAGKAWYRKKLAQDGVTKDMVATKEIYAELANYKFRKVTDE